MHANSPLLPQLRFWVHQYVIYAQAQPESGCCYIRLERSQCVLWNKLTAC